jgi:hypothetical protein
VTWPRSFVVILLLATTSCSLQAQQRSDGSGSKPQSRIPRGSGQVDWPAVTPVDAGRLSAVQQTAKQIDRLIEQQYRVHAVSPNSPLTDPLFCRRVYLHLAGRIPKLDEIGRFVQSSDSNKRQKLVDELLNSHDYVSHMFNYWADILRLKDHPVNNNQIAQPYHEWIKKSLAENTPYDKWVYQMLTAEGRIWENPAVGFAMRDSGMDLDHVDNTVQVFLGTQIGCAQCHDHPFDKWTQHDFYQMASFTFGTRARVGGGDKKRFPRGNPLTRLRNEMKALDPDANVNGTFSRMVNANLFEVYEVRNRRLKLPHDYQYDNGKPNQVVDPRPIFGNVPEISKDDSPREVMAKWMTAADNPRFAKNIANRMWKKAFGVGLIEPVNDIRDDSACSSPELLDFLTSELIRLQFDVRELQRIICNTTVWQREATTTDVDLSQPYYFPGPILRRMTAEQIWDSLLTLAVYDFESFTRPSTRDLGRFIDLDLDSATASQVQEAVKKYDEQFSTAAQRKITSKRNSYKGRTVLARASELPTPLPASHFLRQFGQGDRELIEAATTDGSVSQILTMFNGEITHMMLEPGSVIYDNVTRVTALSDRINVIFYSVLTRPARSSEDDVARSEIKASGNAGYGNVIWALINTKEFLFIQ